MIYSTIPVDDITRTSLVDTTFPWHIRPRGKAVDDGDRNRRVDWRELGFGRRPGDAPPMVRRPRDWVPGRTHGGGGDDVHTSRYGDLERARARTFAIPQRSGRLPIRTMERSRSPPIVREDSPVYSPAYAPQDEAPFNEEQVRQAMRNFEQDERNLRRVRALHDRAILREAEQALQVVQSEDDDDDDEELNEAIRQALSDRAAERQQHDRDVNASGGEAEYQQWLDEPDAGDGDDPGGDDAGDGAGGDDAVDDDDAGPEPHELQHEDIMRVLNGDHGAPQDILSARSVARLMRNRRQ